MKKDVLKKTLTATALSAAVLAGASSINKNNVKAATNEQPLSGVLTVKYNGRGGVNLLNGSGKYQNKYVYNNQRYKVFAKATIGNRTMYRLGTDSQWIPEDYTDFTGKSASVSANSSSITAVRINYVPGYGINVWDNPITPHWTGKRLSHNTSWRVFGQAIGHDGAVWYNLGGAQWIPSYYTNHPVSAGKAITNTTKSTTGASVSNTSKATSSTTSTSTTKTSGSTTSTSTTKISGSTTSTSTTKSSDSTTKPTTSSSYLVNGVDINSNSGMWSDAEIKAAEQYFLNLVNDWNAKQGNIPSVIDNKLQMCADNRAEENVQSILKTGDLDNHYPNGKPFLLEPYFQGTGASTEVQGMQGSSSGMTPKEFVDAAFDAFIYRDGPSWQHRESLRTGKASELGVNSLTIGIGIRQVRQGGMIKNVIDAVM